MATTITVAGVVYTFPSSGEGDWGSEMTAVLRAMAAAIASPVTDTWHVVGAVGEVAFANNYTSPVAETDPTPAAFTKHPDGRVWLKGCVDGSGGSVGQAMWIFPAEYRPSHRARLSVNILQASYAVATLRIEADGTFIIETGSNHNRIPLDGLSFSTT